MIRLARPIRREDTNWIGGKRTRAVTMGALNRAARSGLCTAQFLGTASKKTKMTTTSKTAPTRTPRPPKRCSATTPTRVAETSWQIRTSNRMGLRNLAGSQPGGPAGGPPALLVDQGLGLDPVHAHQAGLGQGQHARGGQEDDDHDDQDDVLGVEAVGGDQGSGHLGPVEAVEQLLLERLHPLGLGVLLVVHAEQVQQAVHHQEGDLVVEGDLVLGRVAGGHRRADDHVAEQGQRALLGGVPGPLPPRSGERPVGPGSSSMGKDSTSVGPLLPRNCSLGRRWRPRRRRAATPRSRP